MINNKPCLTQQTQTHRPKKHSFIFKNLWLVILLPLLTWNCKKDNYTGATTGVCPMVISTDPANGATNVPTIHNLTATFNETMDPSTINALTFIVKQGGNVVPGTVTSVGAVATFTPSAHLQSNKVYSATITTGVRDLAGNYMVANYDWSFNTGVIPIVVSTDPANGATNVALNKIITATFSTFMSPSTINATTFTVKQGSTPVAGTVTYSGMTATFTPTAPLLIDAVYTGTITTGATDTSGNSMAANYVWTFVTGDFPKVISTDPANGATNVGLDKIITATFNKVMDPATINAITFTLKQGATSIPGTVTYSGVTATFTPASNLAPNTLYTGTITTGAKDTAGNALITNYIWTFNTGTLPAVISTDPANGAMNVPLDKIIRANFSTTMNPATINNTTFTLKQGATPIAGTVTYSGTTATFTPAANLTMNTVYTGTITTGAKDLFGNSIASNFVWSFTTGASPTVISTDPANGATNVPVTKIITATFSTTMDANTINATTFKLNQGATPIPGTVSYSGATASFNPTANLATSTLYTATITTGARDLNGNPLVSNYVWTFTTAAAIVPPPPPPPLGVAAIFGIFGGSAGITNQGVNTVVNNGSIGTTGASTLITGFHDGTTGDVYTETPLNIGLVTGRIYTAPPPPGSAASFAIATQGLADANSAYNNTSPASMPGGTDPGAGELGNLILPPGVYKSASGTFNITAGNLTLDGQGNPNARWVFQTAAGLTVGVAGPNGAKSVLLINGASASNVFWHVGSAAVINGAGGGVMSGTIISSAGASFSTAGNATQTVLNGRVISLNASVTVVNTTINVQ